MNNKINNGINNGINNPQTFINIDEFNLKIFKLLNINSLNKVDESTISDIKKLIELFDINIDFDYIEVESKNKIEYKYSLNDSGLLKLDKIRNYLVLKSIIESKLNEKFEYKKTIKGIHRYNNNQEKEEFKIPVSINGLDLEISKLNNKLTEKDNSRLEDVNKNYLLEKEKEIKYKNLLNKLNVVLDKLNVDSDIDEITKKFNLNKEFVLKKGLYSKKNLEYIVEIEKEVGNNNTLDENKLNYDKGIIEKILKYKKYIIGLIGITGLYLLFENSNIKNKDVVNENIPNNSTNYLPYIKEEIKTVSINRNSAEKNIENHGNIFSESMIHHYIYSLENNLLINMNSKDYFMHFFNKNYIYHFSNFGLNRMEVTDLTIEFNYINDKNRIDHEGFIILDNGKKYIISSEFDIQKDDYYQDIGKSREYLLFKDTYKLFDKTLQILLNDSIKISDYKNNPNYREEIELIVNKKVSKFAFKDILESNFPGKISGRHTVNMVNKVFMNEDGKLIIDFSLGYKGKSYMYSYSI